MVRDRTLLARREGGVLRVPAEFIGDGELVKGLPGLLTLLADAGFTDDEALDWLFREDPSLPGTPIRALVEDRGKEVKRRAQALAY
ncbi:Rv2175c family DNA-binding protein [Frankia sp. AiPs1]|nr:Rv2175c family DNA-binding protein [Frankia sp. AiPs1]MCM3923744.1 Rv2175c family DNA-binding protein [Frankia sp. AiPs1]